MTWSGIAFEPTDAGAIRASVETVSASALTPSDGAGAQSPAPSSRVRLVTFRRSSASSMQTSVTTQGMDDARERLAC
jgi:hypothetical protein